MRPVWVIGNWKMHGSLDENQALLTAICDGLSDIPEHCQIGVCPPAVYIPQIAEILKETRIVWGGQNISQHPYGAYTGEVSAPMLYELGCHLAIVGHSERRHLFSETDHVVAEKFIAAKQSGLMPILCVGELLQEREAAQTETVVHRQLDALIEAHGIKSFQNAIVAYEPVWAIGTGQTASADQAQAVHRFIRDYLSKYDSKIAKQTVILYGGSVKPNNAAQLFAMPDIDGGLIGGAALQSADFLSICQAIPSE